MTAPENTRERLAEALIDWWEHESGEEVRAVEATTEVAGQYADALLPLIDTLLREQAEGIAALADEWETKHADHVRAAAVAESELIAALQVAAGSVRKLCADELRARTFGGER